MSSLYSVINLFNAVDILMANFVIGKIKARLLSILGIASSVILAAAVYSALNYGIDPKHCDGNYILPSYTTTGFKSSQKNLNDRYNLVRHHENNEKVGFI